MSWKQSADALKWNIRPFIGGQYRESKSTVYFDSINPATEGVLKQFGVGAAEDVDAAVQVARRRFEDGSWSNLSAAKRAEILMRWADLIALNKRELALLDSVEMGKPIQSALHDVASLAVTRLRQWAGFADKLIGASAPAIDGTLLVSTYEPRGVVGAIIPWNFPTLNVIYKCAPALAAGNTVVLKPSELTPASALRLAELAVEAGVPEGVMNVVPGIGETVGVAMAAHPGIDFISFTGSTTTGRKIMELCGRSNGKPLILECGGKSPQVVFADVSDVDKAADEISTWWLTNQGQVCVAHTRLLVEAGIEAELTGKIVERAKAVAPGDPMDDATTFGPLASPRQRDRVSSFIRQGLEAGANPVLRGSIQERDGCYVSPTIFNGVCSAMSVVREEIFGPVLCIQSFESEDEATMLANDNEYGLAATVWTRDMGRGKRMARAIRAGSVFIRTGGREGADPGYMLGREPQKGSGFGVEHGVRGLEAYSTLKAVCFMGN